MNKTFKIVILTAVHTRKAAGIVAYDLMSALKGLGHEVLIITNSRLEKKYEDTVSVKGLLDDLSTRIIDRVNRSFGFETKSDKQYYMSGLNEKFTIRKARRIIKRLTFTPDGFIYLFPQKFLTAGDLYYLNDKTKAPIFWYMMDMAPMTGGCHYAWDCTGYTRQCGACPGIFSDNPKDKTNKNWKKKSAFIEKTNITPIAGSEWQYKQLKQSSLFKNKPHHKLLLPIDDRIFIPSDKITARKEFGLPLDKRLIFFGSVNANEYRKGFKELTTALSLLSDDRSFTGNEDIHLVIAGKFNKELNEGLAYSHSFLGFLDHDRLAQAFNASDVFVCPSIQDSGPMMINQSVMCGTPVVSFETGVAPDLVHTGVTGYCAKIGDTEDLAKGIKFVLGLSKHELEIMQRNCCELAKEFCNPQTTARQMVKYIETNIQLV